MTGQGEIVKALRVLVVSDEEANRLLLEQEVTRGRHTPLGTRVDSPSAMNAALADGKERLKLVARARHDAIWDWDITPHACWWGECVQALFGYRLHEMQPIMES